MSAFSVGTTRHSGRKDWWQKYEMAGTDMSTTHDAIRDATHEEAALMQKVVWEEDTIYDRDRLRHLLESYALEQKAADR